MISIIDYGVGNVKAFLNIYNKLGHKAHLAKTEEDLIGSTKVILPGVGHFDYAMTKFLESGLSESVNDLVLNKKIPALGICVGMQMLARKSEEGSMLGLGWMKSDVIRFDIEKIDFRPHLPHMGWNDVDIVKNDKILTGFPNQSKFYFLHSYYMACDNVSDIIATSEYGSTFSCIVNHENIYGIQCHPEKSHGFGIKFLDNFAKL
ncbi:imidazole glycerol phosphate synthase subunit HisH [Aquiflexum sp. TKW24L]|uniref:imidazole glycerol phosphate synthase subunit HisH n=1 Tax=Aquiflexum sp. TKW24L TaxID=2942212 RepID=UPI0020BD8242|nr:imidazole glycerol phosphate synthase subunit HisH [Aquiflexum sp. TKW24L]MCL6260017.1 imidazole glycerol phosphate synthase subunit HisH [Aquiflexum sp. TKW24L]